MMNRRRRSEAALRFEGRRRRQDDAPRLRDEIPRLQALRLELEELSQGGTFPLVSHTRIVVVARAPALFELPCCDADCDGSHDLTRELLLSLRNSAEQTEGEHECMGERNNSTCHHHMRYRAVAEYSE